MIEVKLRLPSWKEACDTGEIFRFTFCCWQWNLVSDRAELSECSLPFPPSSSPWDVPGGRLWSWNQFCTVPSREEPTAHVGGQSWHGLSKAVEVAQVPKNLRRDKGSLLLSAVTAGWEGTRRGSLCLCSLCLEGSHSAGPALRQCRDLLALAIYTPCLKKNTWKCLCYKVLLVKKQPKQFHICETFQKLLSSVSKPDIYLLN